MDNDMSNIKQHVGLDVSSSKDISADVQPTKTCASSGDNVLKDLHASESSENTSDSDSESFEDATDNLNLNSDSRHEPVDITDIRSHRRKAMSEDDVHKNTADDEKHDSDRDSEEEGDVATVIDEKVLLERESLMTDEEKQIKRDEARRLKDVGNEQFKSELYQAALQSYTDALSTCLLCHVDDRSILYSNRAASKMKLLKFESAITDCTKALELKPDYMKALLRRAELYEKTDKLEEALADYQMALERDPSLHQAQSACMQLPDKIKERNEKLKDEMLAKLKDLGNMVLRPFGLSTNNFKMQQDPATGSYSINFQQNPNNN